MKEKVKKWKRRWKKLSPFDRKFYRGQGFLVLFNLILSFVAWTCIINLLWITSIIFIYTMTLRGSRITAYRWYLIGGYRAEKTYYIDKRRLMYRNAELEFSNKRLNSDYKKLEYDYNQLKKSINNPKKKKK